MNNPDKFPPRLPMQRATGHTNQQPQPQLTPEMLANLRAKFAQLERLRWLAQYLHRNRN